MNNSASVTINADGVPSSDWSTVTHRGWTIELVASDDWRYYWADEEWHQLNYDEQTTSETEEHHQVQPVVSDYSEPKRAMSSGPPGPPPSSGAMSSGPPGPPPSSGAMSSGPPGPPPSSGAMSSGPPGPPPGSSPHGVPSESSTVSLSAEIEVIYEMLKHSFSHLLSNQGTLSKRLLTCLWLVLFGAIITYGIFWIWMLILGQESNDGIYHFGLYTGSILLLLFTVFLRMGIEMEEGISVVEDEEQKEGTLRLIWGRIDSIMSEGSITIGIALFFGCLFGNQVALIHLHLGHIGISDDMTIWTAFLMTFDNLMNGLLLGFLEMYDVHLIEIGDRSHFATTIFLIFRLLYDAFFLLWILSLFRSYQLGNLLRECPPDPSIDEITAWMEMVCHDERAWIRRYPDEIVFLMMCKEYLKGNENFVKELRKQFPQISISDELNQLFVNPETGNQLF